MFRAMLPSSVVAYDMMPHRSSSGVSYVWSACSCMRACSNVLLPAGSGMLHAYEAKYLMLFEELAERNGGRLEGAKFGHFLHPNVAPPALMADP